MALTISATDSELPKPVNVIFQQTFLREAQKVAPYFAGTMPAMLEKNRGSATVKWRRVEDLTVQTTALGELTGTASYMQGRDADTASVTDITATVSKFGNFLILNEEDDVFNFTQEMDAIMRSIGRNAGESLNALQRNEAEDNLTQVFASGDASDGAVDSALTANAVEGVVQTLVNNSAMVFTPMTGGTENIGTAPILPGYWGICSPYVASDIRKFSNFTSIEKYHTQTATVLGEFGIVQAAGVGVRFIQTPTASVDANAGAAVGSTGLRSTGGSDIDLFTTVIYGQEAIGSVGLGVQHTDGIFRTGDELGAVELIPKERGTGGTSDPYNEISTLAWKAWHTGKVLNSNWGRAIRSGATDIQ